MDHLFSEDWLVSSPEYSDAMESSVLPWLKSRETVTILPDPVPLYCISYKADAPVATVFLVHGFTENAYKYSELIFSLLHNHFSVVVYDQRGHGRSWRAEGIPDPSVTHVGHFAFYVEDLARVCDHYQSLMPKPWMVFAHSMGGAVASLFLEQHHDIFSAAVLCAPMIAPNLGGVPAGAALALGRVASYLGRAKKNPFFMKPYSGPEDFATSCATDPARFAWYDAVKAKHKEFQNSIPSYQWSLESIGVTAKILAAGAPESISCPVLLFTAEHDHSVMPGPQEQFIRRIMKGQHVFVSGARHEIFRSTNDVFFPWWHRILTFFSGQSAE